MPRSRERRAVLIAIAAATLAAGVGAMAAAVPSAKSPYRKLALFAEVLSRIERDYVEPPDGEKLIVGAIKGMVNALDPHSSFMTPQEYEEFLGEIRGEFCGVGLEVGLKDGVMTVIAPFEGSPADRAGIAPGDQIVSVGGRPTAELSLADAVSLIRGRPGEKVALRLRRPPDPAPFDVPLVREQVKVQSVQVETLATGFARVRVKQFQDGTAADIRAALGRLSAEGGGLGGVVLDLRRNPGGTVDEAVAVADLFLGGGTVLTIRGRNGKQIDEYRSKGGDEFEEVPLVALIDKGSASAAEIVAGAIRDRGRGLVVGTRSFGKGSVQVPFEMEGGSYLKLTVAKYYTPSGRSIQAEGIAPDVAVESRDAPKADEETALLAALPDERDLAGHLAPERSGAAPEDPRIDDYQLRIAFELVRGQARARSADGR
jgi:carboxyl-terminal processing protease